MLPDVRKARVPFDVIVARHRRELLGYLTRLLGNHADAEDACQTTLLRAHRAYASLRDTASVRAWLFTIATRSAANTRRSRQRHSGRTQSIDVDLLPGSPATASIDATLLRALDRLPLRQRAALMLRIFHDQSYAQIAATVGGNSDAARANVYQAIKRLKSILRAKE